MQSESIEDISKPSLPNHPQQIPNTLQHGIRNRGSAAPDDSHDRGFHGSEKGFSPDNGERDANSSFGEDSDFALSGVDSLDDDSIAFNDVSHESATLPSRNTPNTARSQHRQKRDYLTLTDLPNGNSIENFNAPLVQY